MASPRIVFLDVDGTLIDGGERIAQTTVEAIRRARADGHLMYLCTGRSRTEIYPQIRAIGFDGTISAGGGFAEIGDDLVISRTLPEEATTRMVAFYEEAGYDYYLQSYDEVYPSPGMRDRFVKYLAEDLARQGDPRPDLLAVASESDHPALRAFDHIRPMTSTGIAKSLFLADDQRAFERVSEAFLGEFHVITGTIPHMGPASGEVTLHGVNKGSTILQLLNLLGMDAGSAIGIGDSANDVEMLDVCGVGIAMGNADQAIKAAADEVTTSVLDDGVWNAFRRHGLI
ncbi:Cof-type HAD-IIB family hydrolase [Microbacterium sp. 2FI]|uniref:Cof-type HAD-IIB family hydrolase n=1 Tax=Microbacterium sp. 2FI TaxID=2502193 RepID=UPI0010F8533B|nr:Cof-type HAD-IIB family hydrolase [Microbacterium sp. 2FI]